MKKKCYIAGAIAIVAITIIIVALMFSNDDKGELELSPDLVLDDNTIDMDISEAPYDVSINFPYTVSDSMIETEDGYYIYGKDCLLYRIDKKTGIYGVLCND